MGGKHDMIGFDIAVGALSTYDKDGFLGVQIDAFGESKSGVVDFEIHAPHGFYSRFHDPDTDGAGTPTLGCNILFGLEGGHGHAWLGSDPRVIPNLPPIAKGGSILYGGPKTTPTWQYIDGTTGSVTLYVPYALVSGVPTKSMSIEVNVDSAGQETISIIHGSGMSITMQSDPSAGNSLVLKSAGGNAWLAIDDQGGTLAGSWSVQGSLAAGNPSAAQPVALAAPVAQAIQGLISAVASATGANPTGLAQATAALTALASQFTKGS